MHLHHDRHLQTYIDNLNGILEKEPCLQTLSLEQLIQIADRLPEGLGTSLRNNAGGVYNHRFFFDGMAPATGGNPAGNCWRGSSGGLEAGRTFGRTSKRPPSRCSAPATPGWWTAPRGCGS